ncbi:uncharacterized protein LOC130510769 isoform X2 [Raphanus sativus]|uniref:Uncharacterized protein LOC130510769 isoform X2 n=1 Tax=Raphanus sativus TaxID=3726 RepID=A0A9W3DHU8_RAPSA|nr:uncharacterized protein LOC130510769 isoform X2 [Raphanus sativus]
MGPKQKPKQKNKQPIVYEEDYVPIKTLTKYGLDPKTVKTLGNGDIWNNLLMENNITNNKKLLAGIKGLQETYYDKICEAVDDIMGSLNSEVQVFIQKTLVSLEEMYNKKGDDMKPIVRATSKCVEACYSFDEMHETLSARFGQPLRTTQKMYDFYFTGKKGCKAYKQLSLVRAAQRRAEKLQSQKQQLNLDDKIYTEQEQAGENQVHEQAREDRVPEQKEQQAREDQVPEQKEKAGEDQVTEQKEQAEPTKVEEPIKEEDELNTEHKEQVYSESSLLPNLKQEQAGEDQLPEQKEEAESLEVELPIQDEDEVNTEHKVQVYSESSVLPISTQLINYLKEILDAMTSQEKMMEALMDLQTEIATKDDLEAFERDLGRRLEAIGEDIALQVANELESLPRA